MKNSMIYHGGGSGRRTFSSKSGGGEDTYKVKRSGSDTTPNFLDSKVKAGDLVYFTENNPSGDESFNINAIPKVKVSSTDSTANWLQNKLIQGSNITIVKSISGGEEILTISSTITNLEKRLTLDFARSDAVSVGSLCPCGCNGTWFTNTMGYYTSRAMHIKRAVLMCPKYSTYQANQFLRFQIKTCQMNTLRTSDIDMNTGTNLINLDLIFPNANNNYGFYFGMSYDVNLAVAAGDMVFIAHCAMTAVSCLGSSVKLFCEED